MCTCGGVLAYIGVVCSLVVMIHFIIGRNEEFCGLLLER